MDQELMGRVPLNHPSWKLGAVICKQIHFLFAIARIVLLQSRKHLEDVVVVTKTGCRNLTRFPKVLEI
jgi:hypothetical protein